MSGKRKKLNCPFQNQSSTDEVEKLIRFLEVERKLVIRQFFDSTPPTNPSFAAISLTKACNYSEVIGILKGLIGK